MERKYDVVQTAELISLSEMKSYISQISPDPADLDDIESYWEHLILGWMKFVAPFTPSSVDDISHLKCVQDAFEPVRHTPESIFVLLGTVATAHAVWLPEDSLSLLGNAWPTMWIWIQHFYNAHRSHLQTLGSTIEVTQKAFFDARYQVFVNIFTIFLNDRRGPLLSKIVASYASYPGILSMMADMWVREGTDEGEVKGFPSGCFVQYGYGNDVRQGILAEVISVCGTAEGAVHVACQRIERNIGQAQRDYDQLAVDLTHFTNHVIVGPERSPFASVMHASSGVARTLMLAWDIIISSSPTAFKHVDSRDKSLELCMNATFHLLQSSPHAYDRMLDILREGFFPILVKFISSIHSSSKLHEGSIAMLHAGSTLQNILSPATIHRDFLSLIGGSMAAIPDWGNTLLLKHPSIDHVWAGLIKLLDERKRVYVKMKKSHRTVILCGNAKCDHPSIGKLRRCSACKISLYCKKACQIEHWHAHKGFCNNMKGNVQGCVDLSYPSLNFLSHVVVCDMLVHGWFYRRATTNSAQSMFHMARPLPFLNFVELRGFHSNIKVMDADKRVALFPFSDDHSLYDEWQRLFTVGRGAWPVLVAIPRGTSGAVQLMTGITHKLSVDSDKPAQEQTDLLGIRWLHCQ